jgi:type I restriction enzyme S subunit
MKAGWEIKRLVEVCRLITCGVAARPEYVEEGIPFLSAKNVKEGQIVWNGFNCVSEQTHNELTKNNKPLIGDILYTRVGSYGEAAVIEDDIVFSIFVSLTLIKVDEKVLGNYFLKHYLNSDFVKRLAKKSISGSGVGNLNVGTVREFPIFLPPLPEQQRIVSILDEAFAAIAKAKANAEKNLKNAKELFESYLQGVFENKGDGWEEKTLKEVCYKITDGTHQTPRYFDEGIIFLSSKNVTSGKIDWQNIKYIDNQQHQEMHKRVAPKVGDILLAKNGTTGVAAMVDKDVVFDIYVSLAHIRVKEEVIPQFMLYFINSPVAKKQFNKRLKGMGVPNLHLEEIREVVISFPKSLTEQTEIIKFLDKFSTKTQKLESIYQQKLTDLEELKKSILQKAFNGELNTADICV